jgi:ACS family sodium-dependent inorganic phosphate cotransporter
MHCLWSKWSPPNERSRLATFAFSGSHIGSVVALSLGGIIGKYLNWQSIFYTSGGAGLLWTILWFNFISESPAEHNSISLEEKVYIENSYIKVNYLMFFFYLKHLPFIFSIMNSEFFSRMKIIK